MPSEATMARPGLISRLRTSSLGSGLAGLLDQVVISVANLAAGLIVLRLGTKEEFGIYGLGYTAIMVVNGFAASLLWGQLTVSYHRQPEAERPGYAGALFLATALLGGLLALVAFAVASALGYAALTGGPVQQAVAVTILACPLSMAHDISRSYRFLLHQASWALGLDLLNTTLWILLTLAGIRVGLDHHVAALGGYGLACGVTALAGLVRSGLVRTGVRRAAAAVRSVWDQGRWAVSGVAVTAVQNQAHLYLLGWLAGAEQVAEVNAARMVMSPLGIVIIGVHRALLPVLARLHAEGREDRLRSAARRTLLVVLAGCAAYLLLILLFWDLLTHTVLRGDYADIGVLIVIWAVAFAFQAVDYNMSIQLQASSRFRSLMLKNLWTAIPVVVLAIPMILWLNATGSLLTQAAGQAALAIILVLEVRRVAREKGEVTPAAGTTPPPPPAPVPAASAGIPAPHPPAGGPA